jgi:hypothetical protein
MPKVKKSRFVTCVCCKGRVLARDAIPYGESPVCWTCENERVQEDVENYEKDMNDEVLRLRIGW